MKERREGYFSCGKWFWCYCGCWRYRSYYITEKGLQNAKIEDVIGGSSIIQQSLGLLPLTLPYKTVTVTQELTSIPNNLTDAVNFAIKGSDPFGLNFSGVNDFAYNLSAPELFGKKITLSWTAASPEDESIISQYGGIVTAYDSWRRKN